ncbi:MAG: 5'-nucleotidase, lipoprotein e(P4) family [Ferruginibacter sp.]
MRKILIASALFFCACKSTQKMGAAGTSLPQNVSLNGKLFSSLFMQRSAEYRALCLQAYNIAHLRMDNFTSQSALPKAIITDIDETILDNSPYAVHQAYKGQEYEAASWYQWTGEAAADTLPGAASLLKYAASKKIEIFYITNREEKERGSTLKNLQRFNLPNADDAHFFPKQTTSSKEERRLNVMKAHEVILLMGDNLADFSKLFDKKNEADRKENTDRSAAEFGNKFIVFPNPNYGDWESSLYNFNYKLTQVQKDSVIKSNLRSY